MLHVPNIVLLLGVIVPVLIEFIDLGQPYLNNKNFTFEYSWVSRDVIISLGVNSKSTHSHRREIVFHCMC